MVLEQWPCCSTLTSLLTTAGETLNSPIHPTGPTIFGKRIFQETKAIMRMMLGQVPNENSQVDDCHLTQVPELDLLHTGPVSSGLHF